MDVTSQTGIHQFNLRDELFWFGKPRLLLWLIQFITFQNAFKMAMYIWSLMGSKYKKSILSENVRRSLRGWKRKARRRREETSLTGTNTGSSLSVDSLVDGNNDGSSSYGNFEGLSGSGRSPPMEKFQHNEMSPCEEEYQHCAGLDD